MVPSRRRMTALSRRKTMVPFRRRTPVLLQHSDSGGDGAGFSMESGGSGKTKQTEKRKKRGGRFRNSFIRSARPETLPRTVPSNEGHAMQREGTVGG